jgi:hypothetical protein
VSVDGGGGGAGDVPGGAAGQGVWVGGRWFYLAGILDPAPLAPQIDTSVLVGFPAAGQYLGLDGHPSEAYIRTVGTQAVTTAVDNLLGAQAYPENPSQVDVPQPSAIASSCWPASPPAETVPLMGAWSRC